MFNFVFCGLIFGIIAWKKSGLLQSLEPHHCGDCIANRSTCIPQFSRTDCILLPLKFIQFGRFETMCSPKLSSSWWSALGCLFSMKKPHQLICFSYAETKWRLLFLVLAIVTRVFRSCFRPSKKMNKLWLDLSEIGEGRQSFCWSFRTHGEKWTLRMEARELERVLCRLYACNEDSRIWYFWCRGIFIWLYFEWVFEFFKYQCWGHQRVWRSCCKDFRRLNWFYWDEWQRVNFFSWWFFYVCKLLKRVHLDFVVDCRIGLHRMSFSFSFRAWNACTWLAVWVWISCWPMTKRLFGFLL